MRADEAPRYPPGHPPSGRRVTLVEILFVTQRFDREPSAPRGLPLARWMQARGHRVQLLMILPSYLGGVVYLGYRQRPLRRDTLDGNEGMQVPSCRLHDQSALRCSAGYLSVVASFTALGPFVARRPHVTFAYYPPSTATAFVWWRRVLAATPYVYHVADRWPQSVLESGMVPPGTVTRATGAAIRVRQRCLCSGAHAITALSHGAEAALVEQGVPADKVHVVHNRCDEARLSPTPRGPTLAVATGPDAERLRRGARERDIRSEVFVDPQPVAAMSAVNALADAHLVHVGDVPLCRGTMPSKARVIIASGPPCVMAVAGAAAALVREADAGVTCAPEGLEALVAAVRAVHDAPVAQRVAWGSKGRRPYEARSSLGAGAAATLALLEQAARA